jgi:hypothetical protein
LAGLWGNSDYKLSEEVNAQNGTCHSGLPWNWMVLDNLYRHLQEGGPINKKGGNLFAIPLKKLKVKIIIQEATDSFKYCKRFIFQLGSVALYHL